MFKVNLRLLYNQCLDSATSLVYKIPIYVILNTAVLSDVLIF